MLSAVYRVSRMRRLHRNKNSLSTFSARSPENMSGVFFFGQNLSVFQAYTLRVEEQVCAAVEVIFTGLQANKL